MKREWIPSRWMLCEDERDAVLVTEREGERGDYHSREQRIKHDSLLFLLSS